ncbi:integral membrane protein [Mycolicibacterium tokaiense]|uniref:Integral membrane protein n=1 Tax=Mycolicibacterium tokaiense TaxID=39695 RepID=A0A378TN97_9MYCO|nr:integral membrane protein [Mycolicibacterium tokaiense]
MVDNRVHGAVDRATNTTAFEYAARAGYATSGVLHLLLGYIIVRLAFGGGGASQNADQSGALATLASSGGGAVSLWLAAIGLFGLAAWRLAETVVGSHPNEPTDDDKGAKKQFKRAKSLALAIVYCGLAVSAIRFATGSGQNSGQQNSGMSAQLMQSAWGKAVLIIVGLVVIGVGGYHVYKGASEKFLDDLKVSGVR